MLTSWCVWNKGLHTRKSILGDRQRAHPISDQTNAESCSHYIFKINYLWSYIDITKNKLGLTKKKKNKLGTGHVGYRTTIACFFLVNQFQGVSYSRLSFHWSVGCTRTQTSIISFMMSRILIPTAFWDNSTHKNASLAWLSCFSTIGGYTIKDFAWVRQFELIVGRFEPCTYSLETRVVSWATRLLKFWFEMLQVPTRMHLCSQQVTNYAIPLNEIGTTINSRAPWGKNDGKWIQ